MLEEYGGECVLDEGVLLERDGEKEKHNDQDEDENQCPLAKLYPDGRLG